MPSTDARLNTLRSRINACTDRILPRRTQDPDMWREVCILTLDQYILTSHLQELKYRELIMAQYPHVKLKRSTPCLVDIDGCKAGVRNLERALRRRTSTSTTQRRNP